VALSLKRYFAHTSGAATNRENGFAGKDVVETANPVENGSGPEL